MKNIIFSILIIAANSVLFSCASFLEEEPEGLLVIGNFYKNEGDAEQAVNAAYEPLYSIYGRNIFQMVEVAADDEKNGRGGITSSSDEVDLEFLRHNSENSIILAVWQDHYRGIARANTALEHISGMNIDETLKNRFAGEVSFLRAFYYFNLVRLYGDVPLILNYKTLEDVNIPRTPKDVVYQQIIDDLSFAENNLPASYPSTQIGRATKGAAKILLGKVYLTVHEYQKCVDKLAEVIDNEASYGYGLHENYGDNWEKNTENGIEMVFTIEYMDSPNQANTSMRNHGPADLAAKLGITNPWQAEEPTLDLYSQFLDEDERKAETFRTDFVSYIDGLVYTNPVPLFVKYWEEGERNVTSGDANMVVLRYADALLMYAEALNEINQTDAAYPYLNRVRQRAFNSTAYDYSGLSQQDFRTAVWQERRLELAIEGHRFFDLVRTGRFVQRMIEHGTLEAQLAEPNKVEIANNVNESHVVFPIPLREMDLNEQYVQNVGY